jgi:hypothetical protein
MFLQLYGNSSQFPLEHFSLMWYIVWPKQFNYILEASYIHIRYAFLKNEDGVILQNIMHSVYQHNEVTGPL